MKNILSKIPRVTYYVIGIGFLAFLFVRFVLPHTIPFVIATIIAVLIDPLVDFIQLKLKLHRGVAVLLVLVLLFAILTIGSISMLSRIITELQYIQDKITIQGIFDINVWLNIYNTLLEYLPGNIVDMINESIKEINVYVSTVVRSILMTLFSIIKDIPKIIIYTVVTFIATFFMSKDKKRIEAGLLTLLPDQLHQNFKTVRDSVLKGSMGYFRATLTLVSITAMISVIGLLILKVRYVWFLAIVIVVLDLIPVIGPSLLFIPWSIWSVINGNFPLGFGLFITYGLTFITRQILEPQLIGDRIGIHPLLTLFALFVGIRLFGPVGVLVGPLIVITVKAIILTTEKIPEVIQTTSTNNQETIENVGVNEEAGEVKEETEKAFD
ncbi:MAG: sporulation integral membrane protein YtvI [Firmicutes bacterium]|nr:sporulation integral membrane protein YtvI [Bacillota bacterium]